MLRMISQKKIFENKNLGRKHLGGENVARLQPFGVKNIRMNIRFMNSLITNIHDTKINSVFLSKSI